MSFTPETEKKWNHSQLEFLRTFGRDLTEDAEENKVKPLVGRENEISFLIETLCRESKSNPVLVGPAGVGKTAVVEGLAIKIVRREVPSKLRDCRIFSISASSLMSGATYFGMLEARIRYLLEEAKLDKVIVFIDEIHMIMNSGPGYETRDISQQLKPAMGRGELRLIGATTDEEYRRFLQIDVALERRLQPIPVAPLSIEQTYGILKSLANRFSKKNKIEIGDNILRLVLSYGETFLRNRHLPDKAIDLLEQTVAFAESKDKKVITAEDARQVVRRIVGMPANLHDASKNLFENLVRKELMDEVQTRQFCDFLRVSFQGMSVNPERPNAVIFRLGGSPNGTDNLAQTISEDLFATKDRVIRLNFANLNERFEFNQMIGIESGLYRQSPDAPISRIAQMPWCIIVCKGLENASHTVQEIWARALENGFLSDTNNKKIYVSEAIIILSADIDVSVKSKVGFSSSITFNNQTKQLNNCLEKYFSKSLVKLADFIIEDKSNRTNKRRQWLRENLHNNLGKRFQRQGIYLHWDKSIIENLSERMEEFKSDTDWERIINHQILPVVLPFLEQGEKRMSLRISFKDGEIDIEYAELPESAEEQFKLEESLKRELYLKVESWLRGLFYLESEDDFSKLSIHDATLRVDVYFSIWKDQLMLSFLAPIADNFKLDPDFAAYILERNMSLRFGKFAVETDGSVWLEYSMFGEHCNEKTFLSVLGSITETARKYIQKFKDRETSAITSQWLSDEAAQWLENRKVRENQKSKKGK